MGDSLNFVLFCIPILLAFGLFVVAAIAFFQNKIGQGIGFLLASMIVVVIGLCLWASMAMAYPVIG